MSVEFIKGLIKLLKKIWLVNLQTMFIIDCSGTILNGCFFSQGNHGLHQIVNIHIQLRWFEKLIICSYIVQKLLKFIKHGRKSYFFQSENIIIEYFIKQFVSLLRAYFFVDLKSRRTSFGLINKFILSYNLRYSSWISLSS